MSCLRKLERLLGRKRLRAAKASLGVEQLETRDVPSAISIQGILVHAAGAVAVVGAPSTPNDTNFGQQWDLQNISVPKAWSVSTGSAKTVVAVLDTGVDYNHPDLFENIWINQKEIPLSRLKNITEVDHDGIITFFDLNNPINQGPGKITDVNHDGRIDAADILAPMVLDSRGNDTGMGGWAHHSTQDGDTLHPDDLIGWNFVANNNNPFDDNGHGTHVSGTIGAIGNNGIGIAGINWSIQIMALKFLDSTASGTIDDAAAGAAGNNGQNLDAAPGFPPSFKLDNMVIVAATDRNNQLASFSNYGAGTVQLAAPGVNTLSTTPNGQYQYYTGTSMATPHVTGVLALLKSLHPDWTYRQLINRVLQTVEPIAGLKGKLGTGGLLDATAALGAPDTIFIEHLYSDLIGQAPSAADLNSWLRALNTGVSRAHVAQSVWESRSHRGREIDADYVQLLHHHVDSTHLNQWLQVFQNGGTEIDVLRDILTSPDYSGLHASNASFVTGLYTDLLGRAPSAAELTAEEHKLALGNTRASVAEDVLRSTEFLDRLVDRAYRTFLGHGVDGTTLQLDVAALQAGTDTPESVAVAILASPEYFQKK